MKNATVEGQPEIDGDAVVLRVVVEVPDLDDTGGIFLCRMRSFGDTSVERLFRDQAPSADGRLRALAAMAALEYATSHHDELESLFARLTPKPS